MRLSSGKLVKACLCGSGHKSIEMVDYWQMYLRGVLWNTIQLMLILALINNRQMESIDFVLAFPQAPIQTDIYLKPPQVTPDFKILDLS